MDTSNIPTWEELLLILDDTSQRPDDIGWNIYRYLNANYKSMTSEEARLLLLCYLKLPTTRPSTLHSCILNVAIKATKQFPDFRFAPFLTFWGHKNLREEDKVPIAGKDGKMYPSLAEKTVQAYLHSRIVFESEDCSPEFRNILIPESNRMGYMAPIQMVAIKTFVTETNGRKLRSIKLVGSKGEELIADSHMFNCRPWEIAGRIFNVLPRQAKESGNVRVADIAPSKASAEEVFGKCIGYVDRYDQNHDHWHIFDSLSRHFVAEAPAVKPCVGEYVWFAPIIPRVDKFKSAVIISNEEHGNAQQEFGIQQAVITYINTEKDYFRYTIPSVTEGDEHLAKEGFGTISTFFDTVPKVGDEIKIIAYLRRGKDETKRNHIAEIIR